MTGVARPRSRAPIARGRCGRKGGGRASLLSGSEESWRGFKRLAGNIKPQFAVWANQRICVPISISSNMLKSSRDEVAEGASKTCARHRFPLPVRYAVCMPRSSNPAVAMTVISESPATLRVMTSPTNRSSSLRKNTRMAPVLELRLSFTTGMSCVFRRTTSALSPEVFGFLQYVSF